MLDQRKKAPIDGDARATAAALIDWFPLQHKRR
jgi:hypothetical protein